MAITSVIAYYGIHKANKNTQMIFQYSHQPVLYPIAGKNGTSGRSIHIKNVGGGVAINISFKIKVSKKDSNDELKEFHRSVMTGDGDSHNTGIDLSQDFEFSIDYMYEDIVGNKNRYFEKYQYVKESKQLKRITSNR